MSYDAGLTATVGFTNTVAAPGPREQFTGEGAFPGVVSQFNPPFLASGLVSIGEAGQLTLRLSHYVIPQAGGPEIGVFSNVGLIDFDYPNGVAGSPASTFSFDSAVVDVSEDGTSWVSLGSVEGVCRPMVIPISRIRFPRCLAARRANPQAPFTGGLSSFSGLPYFNARRTRHAGIA